MHQTTEGTQTRSELPAAGAGFDQLIVWTVAAAGAVAAFFLLIIPSFRLPAEDAVILFQFSRNLARTGAITYIPHGPHAEGATDFFWMLLISAAMKLGIQPFWFVAVLNFFCLILFGYLIVRFTGRRASALPTLFVMGGFALMPQLWSSAAGFSTLPFACLLLLLIAAVLEQRDLAAPLLALLLCLFRPDGVVFAVPLLLAAILAFPKKFRRLALDAALFVFPGLVYFFWRWHYFGEFLPLPFLVKSDAVRIGHYLVAGSLQQALPFLLFVLVLAILLFWGRVIDVRNVIVLSAVLFLPTLFYLGMRLDQNIGGRFFVYLPLGIAVLIALNWIDFPRPSLLLRSGMAAWLLFLFVHSFREGHGSVSFQFVNRTAVAKELGTLPTGTILTTEAGILPYYSGWKSYDSWGLSTAEFAHHLVQPEDVANLQPDIVMLHDSSDRLAECVVKKSWHLPNKVRTWDGMIQNLVAGADPQHYDLWYVPRGDPPQLDRGGRMSDIDMDCYFIRHDSPLRSGVEADLRNHYGVTAPDYNRALDAEKGSPPLANRHLLDRLRNYIHKR